MFHHMAQRLIEAFLIKQSFFVFTNFESRQVQAGDIKQYAKGPLNCRVIGPFSHGSKVPSATIFALHVITQKVYSINCQLLAVLKLFP